MSTQNRRISMLARDKVEAAGAAAIKQAAFAISGFLFAKCTVFGEFTPFPAALTAAAGEKYTLAATFGAVLGCFTEIPSGGNLSVMAAVVVAALVKWLCAGFFKRFSPGIPEFLLSFGSMAVCWTVVLSATSFSPFVLLLRVGEALLSGTAAYFFTRFFALFQIQKKRALDPQELACAVLSLSALAVALSPLTIASVSPARVIMIIALLSAAYKGHEPAGAIAGCASSLVMALCGSEYLYAAAGFALAGLMAGVFSPIGKIGTAAAFILTNGIVALKSADEPTLIPVLYEVMAASVLFVAMPSRFSDSLAFIFSTKVQKTDNLLRSNLVMRLKFASFALCDVSKTIDKVAEKLKRVSSPKLEDVFRRTEHAVCSHCSLCIYCWETNRRTTLNELVRATELLGKGLRITSDDFGESFKKRCSHPDKLALSLSRFYGEYKSRRSADNRVSEIRGVVSEQFSGISSMLEGLAFEFEDFETYDADTAQRITAALAAIRITADDVSCRCDRFGRMTAEICLPSPNERINRSILMRELSTVCKRDFDLPCITAAQGKTLLTLTEKAVYTVDMGMAQITCEGERLCGDAGEQFFDGKGRAVMLISDGMGSGSRAAVDGAMAAGLMSRLIKAGFGFDCALGIVNSAMLFKSGDESLATVDIGVIDLFDGTAEFYKAGAPASVILKNERPILCEGASLPPGILKGVSFDKSTVTLSDGDTVIMFSDGALADGVDWIGAEAEICGDMTAGELASHIADYARRRAGASHPDDITVMVARLKKNRI